MIEFLTNPLVEIVASDTFLLRDDFVAKYFEHVFIVPKGFVTDLESVPRLPGMYLLFKNRALKSAVLHDWLYSQRALPRDVCDEVFLCAMEYEGVSWWVRRAMYAGVRMGGASAYASKG